jgi:hypothetical protein
MPVAAVSQPIQQRTRFRSSRARRVAGAAEQAKRRKWRRRRDKADEGWGELQLQLCPRNSGWAGHCGDEDYSLAVLGPLDRLEAASLSAGSAPCMDPPACVQFGTPTGQEVVVGGVGGGARALVDGCIGRSTLPFLPLEVAAWQGHHPLDLVGVLDQPRTASGKSIGVAVALPRVHTAMRSGLEGMHARSHAPFCWCRALSCEAQAGQQGSRSRWRCGSI